MEAMSNKQWALHPWQQRSEKWILLKYWCFTPAHPTPESRGFDSSSCSIFMVCLCPPAASSAACRSQQVVVVAFYYSVHISKQIDLGYSTRCVLWSDNRLTSNLKNPNSRLWGRTTWSWSKTSSKSWGPLPRAARLPMSSYAYWRSLTSRSGIILAHRHAG